MVLSLPNDVSSPVHIAALCREVLPLPRILVAVFNRLPCVVTCVAVAADVGGKVRYRAFCRGGLPSPKRLVAKLKTDPELVSAVEFVPTTKATPNTPSAWAALRRR